MKWLVIYTKPQYEIRVSKALNAMGIQAYCPTYKKVIQYSDRKKKIEKPLMPSYVLVHIDEKDRNQVFIVPGVIRYVFWLGKPAEVRSKEIETLQNSLSGVIRNFSLQHFKKGMNYIIPQGPFKGQEGEVLNHAKNKVQLELKGLGVFITLNIT